MLTQLNEHEWEALESITMKFIDTLQKKDWSRRTGLDVCAI